MHGDLFDIQQADDAWNEPIGPGAVLMHGFAIEQAEQLIRDVQKVAAAAPFRHLITPGGHKMSVAMTNCGPLGWVSSPSGYSYTARDPLSNQPWPNLPASFLQLAEAAATAAGYREFCPDACLINQYQIGARMSLHQDKDEGDLTAPIVSVSLGLPATFLWGGMVRSDKPERYALRHGDVVVWGGPDRLRFHGVNTLAAGNHPLTGHQRLNITFRKARR